MRKAITLMRQSLTRIIEISIFASGRDKAVTDKTFVRKISLMMEIVDSDYGDIDLQYKAQQSCHKQNIRVQNLVHERDH